MIYTFIITEESLSLSLSLYIYICKCLDSRTSLTELTNNRTDENIIIIIINPLTDDFATSFLHFSLFSTALWDLPNSRPVHSLMLPSHLFLCLPCLLPPFAVPCKMVLARPDEQETWLYHCSLHFFTIVRRSLCGPIACWILAWTSSLVTWSLYETCSILQ